MISQHAIVSNTSSELERFSSHVVAKCRWDSIFDDESLPYQLQEYLSYFSQTALLRILQKGFDRHIPEDQTLRLDTLVLDLGVLQMDDLETQLSNAIEACLSQQLLNSLRWNKPSSDNPGKAEHFSNHERIKLLNHDQSLTGFIQTFLSTGNTPWWYRGGLTNKQVFLDQLVTSPNELASTLRIVGRSEPTRKRILWQWQLDGAAKIVSLLEPVHHRQILTFAEQLSSTHTGLGSTTKERYQVKQLIMYWVLTFVMTQRGAQFHHATFIEFLVGKYASEYKLKYSMLLEGIHQQIDATNEAPLDPAGHRDIVMELLRSQRRIAQADDSLAMNSRDKRHQFASQPLKRNDDSTLDSYVQAIMHFLSSGEIRKVSDRHVLPDLNQMFTVLLARRPQKLAELLRRLTTHKQNMVEAVETLSDRLQTLTSVENHTLLRSTIAPSITEFLDTFSNQFVAWYHNGWLPVLSDFDCYQYLQSSIVFTLICDFRHGSSVEDFLPSFLNTLNRQYGVDSQQLRCELIHCLTKRSPVGKFDTKIAAYLALNETVPAALDKTNRPKNSANLTSSEKSRLLIAMLRAPKKLRSDEHCQRFAALTNSLTADDFESFLLRTTRQVDRSAILQSLLTAIGQLPRLSPVLHQQLGLVFDELLPELLPELVCSAFKTMSLQAGSTALPKARCIELIRLCEWQNIIDKRWANSVASRSDLIQNLVMASCQECGVSITDFIDVLNLENSIKKHIDIDIAIDQLTISENTAENGKDKPQSVQNPFFKIDVGRKYLDHPLAEIVFLSLLRDGHLPLWLNRTAHLDAKRLCDDLIEYQPQRLKSLITELIDNPEAETRLNNLISYSQLLDAVKQTQGLPYSQLKMLQCFHNGLAQLEVTGINACVLQTLLFQQTMHCWLKDDWHSMAANRIAAHFSAGLTEAFAIDEKVFNAQLNRQKNHFPAEAAIQNKTTERSVHQRASRQMLTLDQNKSLVTNKLPDSKAMSQAHPMTINNAGLVILQSFMKTYFERLELVDNDEFTSPKTQRDAVHHLQYLVTGHYHTEEQHLLLNKILCGIDVTNPIESGVDVDTDNSETANSLIEAMIQHWSSIGASSIDGFRGNWLVRQGSLTEQADYWQLNVETKPYDLLLQQAPVSFSIIKHRWMPKPLNVSWPT